MKQTLLFIFISIFTFFNVVEAQTTETIDDLTPVSGNIGKFSKKLPADNDRVIKKDNFKFEVKTESVELRNGKKGVVIIVQIPYKEAVFVRIGRQVISRIHIFGRITSEDKVTDGTFEEKLSEIAEIEDLLKGVEKDIILRKAFELSDGKYQIGIILREANSGMRGVKVVKFEI